MWLEICLNNEISLLNTHQITYITKSFKNSDLIVFLSTGKEIHFKATCDADCAALIQGLILALNGLDFKVKDDSFTTYIKPLKNDADESLYKYMKLKELLGDRR